MALISLTQGQVALVDEEDYPQLCKTKWCLKRDHNNMLYAYRTIKKGQYILMHRAILAAPPEMQVDHKNRDGLDNRSISKEWRLTHETIC